jgi:dTMP kinase
MAEGTKERGVLIVVEGLDRSGKSTQCELLCEHIEMQGKKAKYLKFPDRTTPTGKMINSYLTNQTQQNDHSIHLLFSANRWEVAASIRKDIEDGVWVVIDRYSYSGAVYSAAKENPGLSLQWAWAPEVGLPQPDVIFFLDISAKDAAARGGYGEERYEQEEMQSRVRSLYEKVFDLVHPLGAGSPITFVTVNAGGSISAVAATVTRSVPSHPPRTTEGETRELGSLSAPRSVHGGE